MRQQSAEELERALRSYDRVRSFALTYNSGERKYSLRVLLADSEERTVTLRCGDVQNLELNSAGEGFERFPSLQVQDSRADGLDRIHFTLDELEHEALFLHCASCSVEPGDR